MTNVILSVTSFACTYANNVTSGIYHTVIGNLSQSTFSTPAITYSLSTMSVLNVYFFQIISNNSFVTIANSGIFNVKIGSANEYALIQSANNATISFNDSIITTATLNVTYAAGYCYSMNNTTFNSPVVNLTSDTTTGDTYQSFGIMNATTLTVNTFNLKLTSNGMKNVLTMNQVNATKFVIAKIYDNATISNASGTYALINSLANMTAQISLNLVNITQSFTAVNNAFMLFGSSVNSAIYLTNISVVMRTNPIGTGNILSVVNAMSSSNLTFVCDFNFVITATNIKYISLFGSIDTSYLWFNEKIKITASITNATQYALFDSLSGLKTALLLKLIDQTLTFDTVSYMYAIGRTLSNATMNITTLTLSMPSVNQGSLFTLYSSIDSGATFILPTLALTIATTNTSNVYTFGSISSSTVSLPAISVLATCTGGSNFAGLYQSIVNSTVSTTAAPLIYDVNATVGASSTSYLIGNMQ